MTHLYRIATGGRLEPTPAGAAAGALTAIGWAADHVLAVGDDETVRSISRGDSTFMELEGAIVTPRPGDRAAAEAAVADLDAGAGIGAELARRGLIGAGAALEPGSPADLAFWDTGPTGPPRIIALLVDGRFTEGDPLRGPFREPPP